MFLQKICWTRIFHFWILEQPTFQENEVDVHKLHLSQINCETHKIQKISQNFSFRVSIKKSKLWKILT